MKRNSSNHPSHETVVVAALALVMLLTVAGADLFSEPNSATVAHANTSANPYSPVQTYVPGAPYSRSANAAGVTSSLPRLSGTALIRKILVLERSGTTIGRQLTRVEKRIDALTQALTNLSAKDQFVLRSTIDDLTKLRDRLEERLAKTNTQIAIYRLQQDGAY